MAIYRALNNLSSGVKRGSLARLDHLTAEQIGKLERVGAVARVAAPPLSELPDWASRAGKLAKVGITDIEGFLEADHALIGKALRVKPETVERYRQELQFWLVIPSSEEE